MTFETGDRLVRSSKFPVLGFARDKEVRRDKAFTLAEMLVVLAIMAMLLGLSLPFTANFGKGLRIKTASRAILGTLRVARSNAITYRRTYSVIFDVEKNQYWIEDSLGKIHEKKYRLPSSIKFATPGDKGGDPITFEEDRVIFLPTGAIEGTSGSITVTDRGGISRNISIIGSTGKITIESHDQRHNSHL